MLLGGLIWGILGDKRGRLSVLFGSILLYSLANLGECGGAAVFPYGVLRFIAGVGLAGELGAAVTLVIGNIAYLQARLRNRAHRGDWNSGRRFSPGSSPI